MFDPASIGYLSRPSAVLTQPSKHQAPIHGRDAAPNKERQRSGDSRLNPQ